MARFTFFSFPLSPSRGTAPSSVRRALRDLLPAETREPAQGPGWFDSSFDLTHGLEVRDAGEGGYDDWLAARAIAERRAAAARRPVRARPHAASAPRNAPFAPAVAPDDVIDLDTLTAQWPASLASTSASTSGITREVATPPTMTRLPTLASNSPTPTAFTITRGTPPAPNGPDDFSRFGIEGLALA